jgi:hypothetical protein
MQNPLSVAPRHHEVSSGMVQAACKPQPGRNFPDFNSVRTVPKVVEVVVEACEVVGTLNNKKTRSGGDPECKFSSYIHNPAASPREPELRLNQRPPPSVRPAGDSYTPVPYTACHQTWPRPGKLG